MNESTPAGRIVAAAQAEKETVDSRGRKLRYRRLGALDRARLFKAIGPANATNAPYMGMAMLAGSVTAIDGVPVLFPATDAQIEAAIAKLDDAGIDAVAVALAIDMMPVLPVAEDVTPAPPSDAATA